MGLSKDEKFTTRQQAEIVARCNEAYDRGGADVLKILNDAGDSILAQTPAAIEYVKFLKHVVEAVRQQLQETVANAESDTPVEENRIITV